MAKKQLQVICTYCPDLGVYHMCDEVRSLDSHFGDAALLYMVDELAKQGREEEVAVLVACTARAKTHPHKIVLLFSDQTFDVQDPVLDPDPLADDGTDDEGSSSGGR